MKQISECKEAKRRGQVIAPRDGLGRKQREEGEEERKEVRREGGGCWCSAVVRSFTDSSFEHI